jgi:cystine transport system substrate-binding protein
VSPRDALAAFAGGVGLVAGVIGCAVAAAVALVALGVPAEGRANDAPAAPVAIAATPVELVVALGLSDPALQAGVVRGRDVVLARGLEVELARLIAERIGVRRVRFVAITRTSRLLAGDGGGWHLAVAGLTPPPLATPVVELSAPYLTTDQVVLLRRGGTRPRTLADLRTRNLCAVKGSAGARAIAVSVAPLRPPALVPGTRRLLQMVQTGACDAAVVDGVGAGRLIEGRKAVLGPVVARIPSGDGLVVAVARSSGIPVADVNRALGKLRANGRLGKLARFWLGLDPGALPALR